AHPAPCGAFLLLLTLHLVPFVEPDRAEGVRVVARPRAGNAVAAVVEHVVVPSRPRQPLRPPEVPDLVVHHVPDLLPRLLLCLEIGLCALALEERVELWATGSVVVEAS